MALLREWVTYCCASTDYVPSLREAIMQVDDLFSIIRYGGYGVYQLYHLLTHVCRPVGDENEESVLYIMNYLEKHLLNAPDHSKENVVKILDNQHATYILETLFKNLTPESQDFIIHAIPNFAHTAMKKNGADFLQTVLTSNRVTDEKLLEWVGEYDGNTLKTMLGLYQDLPICVLFEKLNSKSLYTSGMQLIQQEMCANAFILACHSRGSKIIAAYFSNLSSGDQDLMLEQIGKNTLFRICCDQYGASAICDMFATTQKQQMKFVSLMGFDMLADLSKHVHGSIVAKRFSRVLKIKRKQALMAAQAKLAGISGFY